jgi:hypothetical protein
MERGLPWLVFLAAFIGLAIAGWNEYQKIQAYEAWAADFDRAKYDIKSVLGQKGDRLVWGQPSRTQPQNLQEISLISVAEVRLLVKGVVVDPLAPPRGGNVELELLRAEQSAVRIPFTDVDLAVRWGQALTRDLPKNS